MWSQLVGEPESKTARWMLLGIAATAAILTLCQAVGAQPLQCDPTFGLHGSGLYVKNDACGDVVAPGTAAMDVIRIGGWEQNDALVTSVEVDLPFNMASRPLSIPSATQYSLNLGRNVGGPGGSNAGFCYFNIDYDTGGGWHSGLPDSVTIQDAIIEDQGCSTAGGFITGDLTYRWPSYQGYYCNEIDVIMPFSAIGAAPNDVIQWTPFIGPGGPSAGGLYLQQTTYDINSGTTEDLVQYSPVTYTVGITAGDLVRKAPIVTYDAYDNMVTLHITKGQDNGVAPGYGFLIQRDFLLQNTNNPAFPSGNGPGANTYWPDGDGPYNYTITNLDYGNHTFIIQEANCRGPGAATVLIIEFKPVQPQCQFEAPSILYPGQTASFTANGTSPYTWEAAASSNPGPVTAPNYQTSWSTAGIHTVRVTSLGGSSTCGATVTPWPPPTCAPTATQFVVGTPATFKAANGDGANYAWQTQYAQPLQGSGPTFSTAYEYVGEHAVQVESAGKTATCKATIIYPPCADARAEFRASSAQAQPDQVLSFTDRSTGAIMSWAWEFGDGATASNANPSHAFKNAGSYFVRLTVIEAATYCSSTFEKQIHVGTPTEEPEPAQGQSPTYEAAPQAFAGRAQTVKEGTRVTLEGTAIPADGARYRWRLVQGPHGIPTTHSTPRLTFTAPTLDTESPINILYELQVMRDGMVSDASIVQVTIQPASRHPTPDAGQDVTAPQGDTVKLDATKSIDPDGDNLTLTWLQISGPRMGIQDAETSTPSILIGSTDTGYADFQLTVTDGRWTTSDTVRIIILPEQPEKRATPDLTFEKVGQPVATGAKVPWWIGFVAMPIVSTLVAALVLRHVKRRD